MSTLNELIAHRDTAGARFVAALAEFKAAYVDLDAIERTLLNRNAGAKSDVLGFSGERRQMIALMQHSKFVPFIQGDWEDDIKGAAAVKIREFGTPDS